MITLKINSSRTHSPNPFKRLMGNLAALLLFGALFWASALIFLPLFLAAFGVFGLMALIVIWRIKKRINPIRKADRSSGKTGGKVFDLGPEDVQIKS